MGNEETGNGLTQYWENEEYWQSIAVTLSCGVYSSDSFLGRSISMNIRNLNGRLLFRPRALFRDEDCRVQLAPSVVKAANGAEAPLDLLGI